MWKNTNVNYYYHINITSVMTGFCKQSYSIFILRFNSDKKLRYFMILGKTLKTFPKYCVSWYQHLQNRQQHCIYSRALVYTFPLYKCNKGITKRSINWTGDLFHSRECPWRLGNHDANLVLILVIFRKLLPWDHWFALFYL